MAWRAAWLLLLLCAGLPGSGALQLGTGQAARVGKACVRTPPPRALAPTSTLLAADMFGKTFLAGISIAAASLVTTIFIGFVVRGKYDELEQSFFAEQEAALSKVEVDEVDSEVSDFFGNNLNPEEQPSKPPAETQK